MLKDIGEFVLSTDPRILVELLACVCIVVSLIKKLVRLAITIAAILLCVFLLKEVGVDVFAAVF